MITKKVLRLCLLLAAFFLVFLGASKVQAKDYEIDYTVLKEGSQDASIANGYFDKPITIYQEDGQWYLTFKVNHENWISKVTFDGQEAVKHTSLENETGQWTFKLQSIEEKMDATVKVDIEEEVEGEALSYHHTYPIDFELDISKSQLTELKSALSQAKMYALYRILIPVVLAALALVIGIYVTVRRKKKSSEKLL
ncbi:NEAT domain-containing protein [Streptococcus loxodontisalivarius]|uniref:Heme-binding NEAT domain protein n=1 Tax=Streptococcus loxodontisalivarius TaxID=1349415 RepID=A0ABS2PS93_9STRE|nr:NEAT domain-containing protein [Streptococcus loxodontisalivarius]MBM7642913.1 heme-binding NEAT domain protein [Streptococcus loxodontisalivarius]